MTTEEEQSLEAHILAIETEVFQFLRGYPSLIGTLTSAITKGYARTLSRYSFEAVRKACDRFANGQVPGFDRRYPPNQAELAVQCAMFDGIDKPADPAEKLVIYPIGAEPPPGHVPLGPVEVNFGHGGRIDMRKLSHQEKEYVMEHKRLPDPEETKKINFVPKLQRA